MLCFFYKNINTNYVFLSPKNALFIHLVKSFKFTLKYSVIQKDGLNFVSLYFKIITSDKYDVNYI